MRVSAPLNAERKGENDNEDEHDFERTLNAER
jgi:hypothetical protein